MINVSPLKQNFKYPGFTYPNWNINSKQKLELKQELEHKRSIDLKRIKSRQEWAESRFKPNQVSRSGAIGAFQIRSNALKDYIAKTGKTGDLNDYKFNEQVRDYIFDDLYNSSFAKANNASDYIRTAKALAAYNWGRGNVSNHLSNLKNKGVDIYTSMDWVDTLPTETKNYVNFILRGIDGPGDLTESAYQNALSGRKYKNEGMMNLKRIEKGKSGIYIKPENRGKFNATKKRTGKTTEELTHSKNPITRKRAIFAQNARRWSKKHEQGGILKRV